MKATIQMLVLLVGSASVVHSAALDTNRITQITGLPGTWNAAEAVFKVTAPRNDLAVAVDGWQMPPFMSLTTWAAFIQGTKTEAMIAGDLVLFEDEVNPVMTAALEGGLSVTALHNHFFFDEPKVWGRGPAVKLAASLNRALLVQKGVAFNAGPAQYEQARAKGATILDVCTPAEFVRGHVPGALNLDVNAADFAAQAAKLDKSKPVLVNCHYGMRGARAAAILDGLGFKSVLNLDGGLGAWEAAGNQSEK